ncbi:hypothetical protein AB6A40_001932 [Gnathostoma spinigerum]|uniref:Caffeoyl-CoA O-methyltransferase n=1 Tax=Gnathostoma spinigerum TaxID=75299 RepID=A0ABD6EED5_9BILA
MLTTVSFSYCDENVHRFAYHPKVPRAQLFTAVAMSSSVSKSYRNSKNAIIDYCTKLSIKPHSIQVQLAEKTLREAPMAVMLGAPEVLHLGQSLIRLIKAKKVLDIGTFTGASALAWSIAVPEDGRVLSVDISHENLNKFGLALIDSVTDLRKKIDFKLGKALEVLDALIDSGECQQWDFAFIDADKENYVNYYERCLQLLRPGGVILVDNALWNGKVTEEEMDEETQAIDALNRQVFNDERVDNVLMNLGDGVNLVFKK